MFSGGDQKVTANVVMELPKVGKRNRKFFMWLWPKTMIPKQTKQFEKENTSLDDFFMVFAKRAKTNPYNFVFGFEKENISFWMIFLHRYVSRKRKCKNKFFFVNSILII